MKSAKKRRKRMTVKMLNSTSYLKTFDSGDEDKEKTNPHTTQNIYNPLIIQQLGDGSTVNPNYGTINLDLCKRGVGSKKGENV